MADTRDESRQAEFRCPVCRARQEQQHQCRRCGADLSLLVKIQQRIDYLLAHPSDAHRNELAMLAPQLL